MAIGNDLLFQFSDDAIEGINRVKISNVSGEKVSNMVMNVIVRTNQGVQRMLVADQLLFSEICPDRK